jgi:hypothetical protein
MALELPSNLVDCISRIEVLRGHRVTEGRVWLYVQSDPEYFNEIVADNIALARSRYGFSPVEHSDWVYPALSYLGGGWGGDSNQPRPLNSWILKNPVSFVPTCAQIREQYEWCAEYLRASSDKTIHLAAEEELQEKYVARVCGEFSDHIKLLAHWREIKSPREQQECYTGMTGRQVKVMVNAQLENTLSAKRVKENYEQVLAPEFLIESATAHYAMEAEILRQLQGSMRYC